MKKGETVIIKELDRGQVNYEIAILKHEVEMVKRENFKLKNTIKILSGTIHDQVKINNIIVDGLKSVAPDCEDLE